MSAWINQRIVEPVVAQFKSGATPETLSLSFACGVVGGLFPIPGLTSVVCIAATVLFQLNPVVPQVVNLALTPVQLMCIPLWFDVGKWLLSSDDGLHFSPTALVNGIKTDFFGTMDEFKDVILIAIAGWTLFIIPSLLLLYFVFLPFISRAMPKPKPSE